MSLLDRFRKKGPAPLPAAPTPSLVPAPPLPGAIPVASPSAAEVATDTAGVGELATGAGQQVAAEEPTMRAYDEFGREVAIPVSQWRRDLLPPALEQAKGNPDALSALLLDALPAGAAEEIVPAAAHLQSIDPQPERGAAIHGLVLLAANRAAEAEDVLVTYLGQFGPSATVLTHLARAQAVQNRLDEADATLWRALEADPNDEGAIGLYAARSREREGDFGWQSALERAATLPGAWLPLLWLGRSALDARNRTLAVGLYKQAMERAGRPAPTALLQSVSGDLGQFGLLDDALRLVRPLYEPELHGLAVGNNLLRATLDSGQPGESLALLRDLGRLNRPELAESLRAWEIEIRRRDLMAQAQQNPPQPQLLRIDGPVWLPPSTPGRQLFATEAPRRGTVLFLGSSVTLPQDLPQEAATVLPDTAGRLSRAVPLFLAENAYTLLGLDTQTLVPWADVVGFAMLHQPWPDDAAAAYAFDAGARAAVATHLEATPEGATVTLRVIPAAPAAAPAGGSDLSPDAAIEAALADRPAEPALDHPTLTADLPEMAPEDTPPSPSDNLHTPDNADQDRLAHFEPATVTVYLTWADLHSGASALWPQLAIPLVTLFGDNPEQPKFGRYTPPRGPELNLYLRSLEQLLAINCAITSRNAPFLVVGEGETLQNLFDMSLRHPSSLPVRLMLGEMLLRLRAIHPELLNQFARPLQLLAERHPFSDTEANNLVQAQQSAAFSNPQPPQETVDVVKTARPFGAVFASLHRIALPGACRLETAPVPPG